MSLTATSSRAWLPPTVATERRALLTRAAEQEARRQAARERGEVAAMADAERELRRLWSRFVELGGECSPHVQKRLELVKSLNKLAV